MSRAQVVDLGEVRRQATEAVQGPAEPLLPAANMMGNRYTDHQLAVQFWALHDQTVCLHPSGSWMIWKGRRWETGDDEAAHLVRQFLSFVARGVEEGKKAEGLAFRIEDAGRAGEDLEGVAAQRFGAGLGSRPISAEHTSRGGEPAQRALAAAGGE